MQNRVIVFLFTYSDGTTAVVDYALPGYKITKPDGTVIGKIFENKTDDGAAKEQKRWAGNKGIFWAN